MGGLAVPARAFSRHVLIGNFLVTAPCGIAWVIDDSAAFVLDTGGQYVAGTAAPDDSFHAYRFAHDGGQVTLEWGRAGNNVVGRLSSDKQTDLDLKLSSGWPGWASTFSAAPDGATGVAQASSGAVNWTLRTLPAPKSTTASSITVTVTPGSPVLFVAGVDTLPDFGSVGKILDKARDAYAATRPTAMGAFGDFVGAIADNMNNSRIYNHMLAHSVSRGWAGGNPNNDPYFCWDSFFTANLAALNDPVVARNTVRAILSYQTPEGLVPNYGHWKFGNARLSADRSQPPMASLCVWKMHERYPDDRSFLEEIYPKLVTWHEWWPKYRDAKHDGLLEWGSTTGGYQEAQWETGWDDNLHYAGVKMRGTTMDAYSVDLCSMWSMDAHYLALIADFLGNKRDAARFRGENDAMNRRINEQLWNSGMKCYCSRYWSDAGAQFLTRLTPMNFYPLICGAPDSERAKEVLDLLTDPTKFWGPYLLPTLAYDDLDYHQQEYWRGDVWAPTNSIVWQGIKKYASPAQIAEFADRSVDLFMRNWLAKGVCSENYLSTDGTANHDPHYTWGALLSLIGLESIVDIDDSGDVVLNGAQNKTLTLTNIPLLGRTYSVKTAPGMAELVRNGKVVLTAKGTIVRAALH
jgi:hypothetical protein